MRSQLYNTKNSRRSHNIFTVITTRKSTIIVFKNSLNSNFTPTCNIYAGLFILGI